ncbi:hypothetical protein [Mammaliicoccus sciuri]|uniref:hypothetical protein n=1 Tax=Mammaliicoccus sciuri TaxID=1296 RepID=UPI001953A42D|nr:hypothetical protein [Mammaliicoccus sciuri]
MQKEERNKRKKYYQKAAEQGVDYLPCFGCWQIKHLEEFAKAGEKYGSKTRQYRQPRCRDCNKTWQKEFRKKNPELMKTWSKKTYKKHKEKRLNEMGDYYWKNKEKIRDYNKKYREKNKLEISYQRYSYRKNNVEKLKLKSEIQRKKLKEKDIESYRKYWREYRRFRTIMTKDLENNRNNIYKVHGNKCALSDKTDNLHIEHFIPITTGHGDNSSGNCYPLYKNLNISKGGKNPFEWVQLPHIKELIDISKFNNLVSKLAELNGLTTEEFKRYVNWCFDNKRTNREEIINSEPSIELWKKQEKLNGGINND